MAIGNIVYGDRYFPRPKDEKRLWRKIEQGNHLLLLAPRRVGKSSMIHHLKDNPKDGYSIIYAFVQDCETEEKFYKKILKAIYDCDYISQKEKIKNTLSELFGKIGFKLSLSSSGIEAEVSEETTPKHITHEVVEEILLKGLKDSDCQLVIAIDEFPDVLDNIYKRQGIEQAELFLSGIRTLCHNPELNKKVQFIYTGSIGLDTLAEKLEVTNLINMLDSVTIKPLTDADAEAFIDFYFQRYFSEVIPNESLKTAILKGVGWNMPYYLGLCCEALIEIYEDEEREKLYANDVEQAINALLSQSAMIKFSHWSERLNRLEITEQAFVKQMLSTLAEQSTLHKTDIIALHKQHEAVNLRHVLNCLRHDGYIYQVSDEVYQFTSPLLRQWWQRYGY